MSAERDRASVLAGCNLSILRKARDDATTRGDIALATDLHRAMEIRGRAQTPEIENSGRLFEHVEPPSAQNGARFVTRFSGDPLAWMAPFMQPGVAVKLNRDAGVVKRETVKLRAGERVQIVQSNGSIRQGDF